MFSNKNMSLIKTFLLQHLVYPNRLNYKIFTYLHIILIFIVIMTSISLITEILGNMILVIMLKVRIARQSDQTS